MNPGAAQGLGSPLVSAVGGEEIKHKAGLSRVYAACLWSASMQEGVCVRVCCV